MQYECKITVLDTKVFPELQEKYLADPKSGKCPFFNVGDTFVLKRTAEQDDFYHLMNGKFCGEAWDAISRYVYSALQGGSIMRNWTNDDRMMLACCNDGTRPVIFKIERIDIPETAEEEEWLSKQDFINSADNKKQGSLSNDPCLHLIHLIINHYFLARFLRGAMPLFCGIADRPNCDHHIVIGDIQQGSDLFG